jgi:cytochrome P450
MRLDPFSDTYNRNPAATWKRILNSGQLVGYDLDLKLWLIAGHDNVRTVLSDPVRFSNAATLFPVRPVSPAAGAVLAGIDAPNVAVSADAPQHSRIRALLRHVFPNTATRAEQQWGDLVTRRAEQIADELADADAVDLVDEVAVRFALPVILDVLGLPADNAADIRGWTDAFKDLVWGDPTDGAQLDAARGSVALWHYCTHVVDQRVATGDDGPGLVGDLLRYRAGDDARLSLPEAAALVLNLLGAGWETTAGALGHALEHALVQPERWDRLAHDEHYRATHIEETLRYAPVVDGWLRLTTTDVTIDGVTIPAGSRCLLLLGTANHDPDVFPDPDAFHPARADLSQHVAFGYGAHYCIGAALARLELATMLRVLAQRLPGLRLGPDYVRRFVPNMSLHNHTAMPALTNGGRCPIARSEPARTQ